MKLKIVAAWLKLCIAAVKPKSKYSVRGKCCSQPGHVLSPLVFFLYLAPNDSGEIFSHKSTSHAKILNTWTASCETSKTVILCVRTGISSPALLCSANFYTGACEPQRHKFTFEGKHCLWRLLKPSWMSNLFSDLPSFDCFRIKYCVL